MAEEKEKVTKIVNKPRVHGVSLVGSLLTGAAAAAAFALPFLGVGGGLLMVAAGGVLLASAVGFAIFRGKKRKAERLGLKQGKVEKKDETTEEEKLQRQMDMQSLKERMSLLDEVDVLDPAPKQKYALASKVDDEESTFNSYMVGKLGPKTFAIYEDDGKNLKTDSNGKPLIFTIENNKEYRRKLFDYISSKSSGNCAVKIFDSIGNCDTVSVDARNYSKQMGAVMTKIGEVARQIVVHEPPVLEA